MSPRIGPVTVLPPPGQDQLPLDGIAASPATRELVDAEVRRIIDECYAAGLETLREHRTNLEQLSRRLLDAETLDEQEAYAASGLDRSPPEGQIGEPRNSLTAESAAQLG